MTKTFAEELDELFDSIRGTCDGCEHPRCLDRIKAGKKIVLKLVEERIIGEDEAVDNPPCCDGECGGMTFDEYDHENAAPIARNRSRQELRLRLYEGVEDGVQ